MNIVVIGSINMDYVSKVEDLPKKGETILASAFHLAAGGKGANQAVAARRLGANVQMIGVLGKDGAGKELSHKLEAEGISVDSIKLTSTPTGNAMITVADDGSNTIVVYPGANSELDETWLMGNSHIIGNADFVILQLEIPMKTIEAALKLAKSLNKKIILNPAPAAEIPDELYSYIDILTPNETELYALTGIEDVEAAARSLLKKGAKSILVTLGEKGCLYISDNDCIWSETFKVNAIDSTAAGDSFNGALAVALGEGTSIENSLRFANAVGALTTTKSGAQMSLPYRKDVEMFLKTV